MSHPKGANQLHGLMSSSICKPHRHSNPHHATCQTNKKKRQENTENQRKQWDHTVVSQSRMCSHDTNFYTNFQQVVRYTSLAYVHCTVYTQMEQCVVINPPVPFSLHLLLFCVLWNWFFITPVYCSSKSNRLHCFLTFPTEWKNKVLDHTWQQEPWETFLYSITFTGSTEIIKMNETLSWRRNRTQNSSNRKMHVHPGRRLWLHFGHGINI